MPRKPLMPRARDRLARAVLRGHRMPVRERLHVRHEAPDLILGDAPAPGRHAVRPPFMDRLIDVGRRAAEVPASVLETRAHRAGAVRAMTIEAVVRDEQLPALGRAL